MFSLEICYGYDKTGQRDVRGMSRMTERPRTPSRARHRDQRREQMLHAALEVISERGFADTRIADIAERIGISPALVIYYFKTKDQLLTEAIRHYEDTWYAEGKRRMAALPTAAARLEEFVAMNLLPEADPEPHDSTGSSGWTSGRRPRATPRSPSCAGSPTSAGGR